MSALAPFPPEQLLTRVGTVEGEDPVDFYAREGARVRTRVERLLPADWTWPRKRVLDFGCGSGRVLRHFLAEAEHGEFHGCDIDARSIAWLRANLSPPLHPFQNELEPPLALPGESIDLVWATSVFTHIEHWSGWLLEMHRVLAPGGRLIVSFLGDGVWDALVGEPYRENEVGMTVMRHWLTGGSWVFHSEWWLRAHWGRLFDVLEVARPPRSEAGAPEVTHSYLSLQKRPVTLTREDLERPEPDEPREIAGLQTNLRLRRRELDEVLEQRRDAEERGLTWEEAARRSPLGMRARELRRRTRAARG